MFQSVEGQAWELGWRADHVYDLDAADYLRMITKKTAWYTAIFPCRAGALIGTKQELDRDQFVQFGYFLGATFQIQDDILNVAGRREIYSKDFAGDIVEGKRTLMLIHLFRNAPPRDLSSPQGVLRALVRASAGRNRRVDPEADGTARQHRVLAIVREEVRGRGAVRVLARVRGRERVGRRPLHRSARDPRPRTKGLTPCVP